MCKLLVFEQVFEIEKHTTKSVLNWYHSLWQYYIIANFLLRNYSWNWWFIGEALWILHLSQGNVTVGPSSVGYRLTTEALCFGGQQCTTTDVAIAAGVAPRTICTTEEALASLQPAMVYATMREIRRKVEAIIDSMKVSWQCSVCFHRNILFCFVLFCFPAQYLTSYWHDCNEHLYFQKCYTFRSVSNLLYAVYFFLLCLVLPRTHCYYNVFTCLTSTHHH